MFASPRIANSIVHLECWAEDIARFKMSDQSIQFLVQNYGNDIAQEAYDTKCNS
jgi:hypothetical protein